MFKHFIFATFCIISSVKSDDVTFKNITIHGYSVYVHKFKTVIESSKDLQSQLPAKAIFDAVEIKNQSVPVLYENSVADIRQLDELTIESCGLLEIRPGAFQKLENIRVMSFKHNKLEEIKNGVFSGMGVSTIDLSQNVISTIQDDAFSNMKHLLNVRLSDNKIAKWNSHWFQNTPLLTRVSLQNNLIKEILAHSFKNLAGEKQFGKIPLTINLVFSYNEIAKIDLDAFKDLEKINNLWLDNNQIEEINSQTFEGLHIDSLRLNGNKLKCLKGDLKVILSANSTSLDSNPWDCSCLATIKKFAEENKKTIDVFYADMNCYADRIHKKMEDLKRRLKEIKDEGNLDSDAIEKLS